MKKVLALTLVMFFASFSLANAAEKAKINKTAPPVSQQPAQVQQQPQNMPNPSMPVGPMPGTASLGMVQEMIPVVNEAVQVLKDLLKVTESTNLASQYPGLIQRANDIIKRGETAVETFRKAMGSQVPVQTGAGAAQK